MTDGLAAPWHPVALGIDVPAGVTRAVILQDREIVLWRGDDGVVRAWEDRCPHRGMRLSYGFVRGSSLNCLYHGWQYEGSSRCIRIPAHPDLEVPRTIRATAYAVRETGGVVWMNLDPAVATDPPTLPLAVPLLTTAINRSLAEVQGYLGAGTPSAIVVRDGLVLALHKASEEKTLLHALVVGSSSDPAARKAGAAAVRELRRKAEALALEAA